MKLETQLGRLARENAPSGYARYAVVRALGLWVLSYAEGIVERPNGTNLTWINQMNFAHVAPQNGGGGAYLETFGSAPKAFGAEGRYRR